MTRPLAPLEIRLAASPAEVRAAQALRYEVFVRELGARGVGVDHAAGIESDRHDAACRHLIAFDALRGGAAVGAMRLLDEAGAAGAGGFSTEAEFDVAPLRRSGRRLLEIGRTCIHPAYRSTGTLHRLWQALGALVAREGVEVLFGLASFPVATPPAALAAVLRDHPAPCGLRPRSLAPVALPPPATEAAEPRAVPPLVRAYLRLGGGVGEGAFHDRDFGCIDLCMVLDVARLSPVGRQAFVGGAG